MKGSSFGRSAVRALAYLVVAFAAVAHGQDEGMMGEQGEEQQQQQRGQRIKLAPETQRLTLEAVSADCYDSVYQVLNGEADQSSLSQECNGELMKGFQSTPLGQLQRREAEAAQTAAVLRLSSGCRSEFSASMAAAQAAQAAGEEGAEAVPPVQPSETCVAEIQKHMKDMQQWVGSATLSKLSNECKKEASTGDLSAECETEFLAAKPSIIDLLEKQNEQKAKEPSKEEKKKSTEPKKKKERPPKPAPPLIDPSFAFFVVWSVLIVGGLTYACMYYYKNEKLFRPEPAKVEAEPVQKSKRQMKKEARMKA